MKFFSSPVPFDFSSSEIVSVRREVLSATVTPVGLDTELGTLSVPAKVHIHPETRVGNTPFYGCRRYLRDRLHLTSPSKFASSEFFKGKVGLFTANLRSFYNRSGKGLR